MSVFSAAFKITILSAVLFFVQPNSKVEAALPDGWPHAKSDLKPDPNVIYGTLENGLRYAVLANETPKRQASIRLLFDVGSKHEYDNERGMAHFIEHMAFNGSKNVPEGEMVKMLERHGLAFGADANAYTSYEHTAYQLDLPNMNPEVVDTAFLLMRETASHVTFDATAIERERGVVLAEKRRINIHAQRSADARLAFTYPGTRMLERRPIGTEEGISSVTRDQMRRFYHQFYRPDNAFLVLVGDFDTAEMVAKIEATFADWQSVGEPRDTAYAADPAAFVADTNKARHFENDHDRSSISITLSKPFEEFEDNRANRTLSLEKFAGNNIFSKRLQNLRLEGKASYLGAGANLSNFNKIARSAYLGLFLEEEKWEMGLQDAVTELNRALAYGFSDAELKELLANLRTNFEYGVSSADKRDSAQLAGGILNSFVSNAVFTEPQTSLDIFNGFAKTISINTVLTEFREQWTGAPFKLFFISKAPVENAGERLLRGFERSLALPVEKPVEVTGKAFAYNNFGTPGEVTRKEQLPFVNATAVRFSNNVMLNLKKTNLQKDTVHMRLRFGRGLLEVPKDKPGIMTLMSGTFTNGGVTAHSATELRKLLAGRTASANLDAGNDTFSFRSAVTPKDVLIQLQLWAAYMTAPAYREEPITYFQQSIESLYHALDNTPGQVARFQTGKYLYGGDPRFYLPSKEAIQRLTGEDLRAFMSDALSNSAVEISIVGDIDIDAAIEATAATFGALPEREPAPKQFAESRQVTFPKAGLQTLYHKGGKDQAILQIYWPTADYSDLPRSAQLDLLRAALSDRIREAVREGLGTSYAPRVSNVESDVFPNFGYFSMTVDAKPSDISRIAALVKSEITELIEDGLSTDDIERARKPLLEGVENAKKNNGHWLGRISRAQSDPKSLTYLPTTLEAWQQTDSAALQQLAAQYLRPDRAMEIHILPRPDEAAARGEATAP